MPRAARAARGFFMTLKEAIALVEPTPQQISQIVDSLRTQDLAKLIKNILRRRSPSFAWSVKCGRGTVSTWVYIAGKDGLLEPEQAAELAVVIGNPRPVHIQGLRISGRWGARRHYLARLYTGKDMGFRQEEILD